MAVNPAGDATPPAFATPQAKDHPHTNPALAQAVTLVNNAQVFGQKEELTFAVDRQSKRVVVRLVDKETRQVIRQIPAEYILRMAQDMPKP